MKSNVDLHLSMGATIIAAPDELGGSICTGDKAIALKLCRNVTIRDITIYRGGHFAIIATGCENGAIDNVKIDTNRDGIDIDCCKFFTIR